MTDRRFLENCELRAADDGEMRIEGVAIRYNSLSSLLGNFREKIAPGCFRSSLTNGRDIRCLYEHNTTGILGRTENRSLQLTDGSDALRFSLRLNPNVSLHRDAWELVKDRTLRGMSFGFVADDDAWEPGTTEDGKRCAIRTVKSGRLVECSLVSNPAYPQTTADARNYDDFVKRALADSDIAERYDELVERYEKIRIF
jgi:HK97 family phage prohead protease